MEEGPDFSEVVQQAVESAMRKPITKNEDLCECLPKTSKKNGDLNLDIDPSKGDQKAGNLIEESPMEKDLSKIAPQNGESHLDTCKDDQEAIQHIDKIPVEKDTDKTPEKNGKSTLDMDISKTVQQNQKSLQFIDLSKTEQQDKENPLDKSS